jgi:hypothetical protein
MRLTCITFITSVLAACGSSNSCPSGDCDPFPTFQDCYDEHHVTESFPSDRAIEICCIDHPIGSSPKNVVCGATTDTCTAYVTANLTDPNDSNLTTDITTACTNYPGDSGRADL